MSLPVRQFAAAPETPRFTTVRWLRIGLLLFVAQALALGLQALLLIHKEADLLTGLTASRIGIAADEVRATFARSAANGLTLAEPRGIDRLLPALAADDPEIAAIQVFDRHRRRLFASGSDTLPPGAADAILHHTGRWSRGAQGEPLLVGQSLRDAEGELAGGVVFAVRSEVLQARLGNISNSPAHPRGPATSSTQRLPSARGS